MKNEKPEAFEPWLPLTQGHLSIPSRFALDAKGGFTLVIHLLGDELARRELALSAQPFVLYAVTVDQSQSYASLFSGTQLYGAILAGAEQAVTRRSGKSAHVERVVLSAWSAGFVGIAAVLSQPNVEKVAAVILIDGLHAPRNDRAAFTAQLQPFVNFSARAAKGEGFMFVSHSSIDPPNFASTTECAHYLIAKLGGKPEPVRRSDPLGLELVESFSLGDFHVRGYAGNDKADHCAQLATLREAYAAVGRRFTARPL